MLAFQSVFLVVALTIAHTVLVESKTLSRSENRVVRDVDGLPAEEDAHTLETIRHDLTRVRHAENRLNTFLEGIQSGFETGREALNTTFSQFMDRVGKGTSDFQKALGSFADRAPKNFPELVERISGDSRALLETLHKRLDALGNNVKVLIQNSQEDSAEKHLTPTANPITDSGK